jgi:hypothetical protein
MTEADDWHALRKRYEAFMATDLGKLYRAYDKAMIDYWRHERDDNVSYNMRNELEERCREATNAFVAKLMELVSV